MILFYLLGLCLIILIISIFLNKIDANLEKKNYFILLGCSLFAMYFYLGSFLAVYLHQAYYLVKLT